VRYEHDDFGANIWQGVVSVGYGYIALKDDANELSFEIGPGYKRYRPAVEDTLVGGVEVPQAANGTQSEAIARGLINYKHKLTDNTSFEDTFLMEAGSKNTYAAERCRCLGQHDQETGAEGRFPGAPQHQRAAGYQEERYADHHQYRLQLLSFAVAEQIARKVDEKRPRCRASGAFLYAGLHNPSSSPAPWASKAAATCCPSATA
jgi:hypothetical protein